MELFHALHTRRSIRKYTAQPVSDADIQKILEAAMMAPSAGNAQPWQFIVVRDRQKLAEVKNVNPFAQMAEEAPLGILVCGDLRLEKYEGFWVQDCAAAMQNLLLAAHGLGLGAVWTGIYPKEERTQGFRRLFGLPEKVIPLGFAVIGHPDQEIRSESRYRDERVHHDRW
ncbi:MAG: nitroreductase family protein [Desulfobacterales bacterium]